MTTMRLRKKIIQQKMKENIFDPKIRKSENPRSGTHVEMIKTVSEEVFEP